LEQIVPDAARDGPVFIAAREFAGIGTGVRVKCPIGIVFQGHRGHCDVRKFGKPLFQLVIVRLAFGQSKPIAIKMDHDADMIRVVEGRGAALEGGLVKGPCGRSGLPDAFRKVVPVSLVAGPAALGGKVKIVPPLELSLWRQRQLVGCPVRDKVPAHGDEGLAALRPEHHDAVGRRCAPIKTGQDGPLDLERVHQSDAIDCEYRWLAIAEGVAGQKARRAIAAQRGDDHPVAGLCQHRRTIHIAMHIVGPAVQRHDHRTIGGASFSVSDIQEAGIDLLKLAERRVRPVPHHTFHLSSKTIRCMKTVQRRGQAHIRTYMFLLVVCVVSCAPEPHKRWFSLLGVQ
jgi:hypothetical protein